MSARKVRCNSLPSFASKPQRTFRSDIVHDEIALAFGRRAVPKLVDILALKDGVMRCLNPTCFLTHSCRPLLISATVPHCLA